MHGARTSFWPKAVLTAVRSTEASGLAADLARALRAELARLADGAAGANADAWAAVPDLGDQLQAAVAAAGVAVGVPHRAALLSARYLLTATSVRAPEFQSCTGGTGRAHARSLGRGRSTLQVGPGLGAVLGLLGPAVALRRLDAFLARTRT